MLGHVESYFQPVDDTFASLMETGFLTVLGRLCCTPVAPLTLFGETVLTWFSDGGEVAIVIVALPRRRWAKGKSWFPALAGKEGRTQGETEGRSLQPARPLRSSDLLSRTAGRRVASVPHFPTGFHELPG